MDRACDRRHADRAPGGRARPAFTLRGYRLADGTSASGWRLAGRGRLLGAWLLDLVLLVLTLGVGWLVWSYLVWARGTTPGRSLLGLTVFGTDTREPCARRRMARRSLLLAGLGLVLALCTLGGSWVYGAVAALGERHQTLLDEWARTVVLVAPRQTIDTAAAADRVGAVR